MNPNNPKVNRSSRLHELQMLVLAYMRQENPAKARETFAQWEQAVRKAEHE